MKTYSDQALDRWAEIYRANNLHSMGVSFGYFMGNPLGVLRIYRFGPAGRAMPRELETDLDEFLPLKPRQVRAQREADFQEQLHEIEAEREADVASECGQTFCHKRRRSADVRVSDGRFLQSMSPLAVVSARCTGGTR